MRESIPDSDTLIAQSHIELEERVRRRAYDIWLSHGGDTRRDTALQDWLEAEREVLGDDRKQPAQDRGTTVGDAHTPSRHSPPPPPTPPASQAPGFRARHSK